MDLGCLKCDARQDCVVDDGDLWGSEPANMRLLWVDGPGVYKLPQ